MTRPNDQPPSGQSPEERPRHDNAVVIPGDWRDLPYLNSPPTDGRSIFLLPFYIPDRGFSLALEHDGRLQVGGIAGLAQGLYVAEEPEDTSSDVPVPLATTLFRHLSFGSLLEPYHKLEADLLNMAATLEKTFVIHAATGGEARFGAGNLMATEIEYAIVNARAFYDQMQFFLRALWRLLVQEDKRELPKSFHALAECDGAALLSKYRLPAGFIEFVTRAAPAFQILRDLRVGIEHHGHGTREFYRFEDGFGVRVTDRPWSAFPLWEEGDLRGNGIGSYLKVVAWIAREMFVVAELLEAAIHQEVPLPPPISDWQVFLRSPFGNHLHRLDEYFKQPWRWRAVTPPGSPGADNETPSPDAF